MRVKGASNCTKIYSPFYVTVSWGHSDIGETSVFLKMKYQIRSKVRTFLRTNFNKPNTSNYMLLQNPLYVAKISFETGHWEMFPREMSDNLVTSPPTIGSSPNRSCTTAITLSDLARTSCIYNTTIRVTTVKMCKQRVPYRDSKALFCKSHYIYYL